MNIQRTAILLFFCSAFLLLSGILLLIIENFIPNLTNISLMAAGVVMAGIGFLVTRKIPISYLIGIAVSTLLIFYLGWLTITNANSLMDILLNGELQLKPYHAVHQQASSVIFSGVSWVLMTVVTMTQFMKANENERELYKAKAND